MTWAEEIDKAGTLLEAEKFESAEQVLRLAIPQAEQDTDKLAITLHNLAIVCDCLGKTDEAEPLLIKAVELVADDLPAQNENYGFFLKGLIDFYLKQQKYSKAEPLCLKEVEHTKRMFGQRHPYVANLLSELADVSLREQRTESALSCLNEALSIMEQTRGADHPQNVDLHSNLTNCYLKLKNSKEAEFHYKRALEIQQLAGERKRAQDRKEHAEAYDQEV